MPAILRGPIEGASMRRPRFIAEHARHANGLLGRLIAFIMARETWRQNLRMMEALGIEQADHVLDIGCGHGRSLTELAARAPQGHIVGLDPSELMVEIAKRRNRQLVETGRVKVIGKQASGGAPRNEFAPAASCRREGAVLSEGDAGCRHWNAPRRQSAFNRPPERIRRPRASILCVRVPCKEKIAAQCHGFLISAPPFRRGHREAKSS